MNNNKDQADKKFKLVGEVKPESVNPASSMKAINMAGAVDM